MLLSQLLNVRDAAQTLAISPWTLRKYITRGIIPCVRIGGRVLIEPAEIERLIAQSRWRGSR